MASIASGCWLFLRSASLVAAAALAAAALAQDKQLVSGPGVGLVNAKCGTCHDVTHITRSKLTRDEWTDSFHNMVKRGMPPTTDAETRIILDYLVAYYGPTPAPAAAPDSFADAAARAAGVDAGDKVGALLNASGCTACHAVDKSLVGPAFKAVADRYRGDAGAPAKLAAKVRQGGAGVWGQTPMPPNAAISEADLKQLVDWVLAQN
jgi:cytochrome c551/c552